MTMHFQEQQERDETGIPTAKQEKRLFTRGELTGMGMTSIAAYYKANMDVLRPGVWEELFMQNQ